VFFSTAASKVSPSNGFFQRIRCAQLQCHRQHGGRSDASARNRQNRDVRKIFVQFRDGFQPFVFRHEKIGDDQIRFVWIESRIPFSSVLSREDLMAGSLERLNDDRSHSTSSSTIRILAILQRSVV